MHSSRVSLHAHRRHHRRSEHRARRWRRAIVRLSGTNAFDLVQLLGTGSLEHARAVETRIAHTALPTALNDAATIPVTIYSFRALRSFTGDDLIELHVPGTFIAKRLIDALMKAGARQADPGEFTARAYLNAKLDLSAAEGVAAVIAAASRRELDAARQLLAGDLAARLRPLLDTLTETLALVEVGIDFTEEDVTFLPRDRLVERLDTLLDQLQSLLTHSARFERLSHEPRIVLLGRPNAGKSTLINALAGHARAVISDVAGTTRDALSARVTLRRGVVTVVDIAGIDDSTSDDAIESQMQSVARQERDRADLLILVHDSADTQPTLAADRAPDLTVYTKADLAECDTAASPSAVRISAITGKNLDVLRDRLDALAFGPTTIGATLALTARHVTSIEQARDRLQTARRSLDAGDEVLAHELHRALDDLGAILGTVSPDDLLGQIFGRFCIGK
ncbi:MAG: 50S ribosome-binding GTPase [Tepidisphaeraceae bacterium]